MGTASLRRRAALLALRPDLDVRELRGNVDTRLRRLAEGDFDAIVLARAGLERLGRGDAGAPIDVEHVVPAPGQGCLALEARADDDVAEAAGTLTDRDALTCLTAERALVQALDASCHTPIGAHAVTTEGALRLCAFVGLPDGSQWIRDELEGSAAEPAALGAAVGERHARSRSRRVACGGRARSVRSVSGIVYLVGAGPGDPGLMTRRSLELIASADAILYDRLIPPGALDGARPDAELRYVGKEPGAAALSQEETNDLLVELGPGGQARGAPQGRRPVRVRARRRGGGGARGGGRAVRGRARRDGRRGRSRLRGNPGHAPRRRLGRCVRDRPRGPREARVGARLGRARPLPRHARALHGHQEPAPDRRAAHGGRARSSGAGGGGGARNPSGTAHGRGHAGRHRCARRVRGRAPAGDHAGRTGGRAARDDRLAGAAAAPWRGGGGHARPRAGERPRRAAARAGRRGRRDPGDQDRAAPARGRAARRRARHRRVRARSA